MTLKLNGTNSVAVPAYAGDDADTGLQCGTNELKLVTGGSARATVDSSGRLLVGTASTYDGEASNLIVASSGHTGITVASTGSGQRTNLYFADGTSGTAAYAGGFTYDHNNNTLLVRTASSEIARFTTTGLTFNGDTASANALNDYEEGTFTPSINSGFTASYDSQAGRYTKVGNVVHFFINIDLSSISGSSSDVYAEVEGLPFTATNTGNIDNAVTVAWQMNLGNSVEYAYIEQSATSIVLLGEPSGGSRTHWNPGQVWDDNNGKLALSGTYTTTA